MPEQVNVFYEGWGERWLWGSLASTTALTGRPQIVFEYSEEAKARGLELSSYLLPLVGPACERISPAISWVCPAPFMTPWPAQNTSQTCKVCGRNR